MSIDVRLRIDRGGFCLDVDLRLPSRGVTALFGPSGCGKTTLLRCIAGLERAPGGVLRVDGMVWQDSATFIPPHKRAVGYVFQEPSLFPHLNARGNLEFALKRVPAAERRGALDHAVDLLGLRPLLERRVDELSGGERQRVAIARALAASPRVLLMDEPLAALDLKRKREILPYLETLHDELEIPLIYVSHDPDEVARLADHLVVLDAGRVQAAGAVGEIFPKLTLDTADDHDVETIIEANVSGSDPDYGLSYLAFSGGRLTIPRTDLKHGQRVRVRIFARDVTLATQDPGGTSMLNHFAAVVDTVELRGATAVVCLRLGQATLWSQITRKSLDLLGIAPGVQVYALIKSVAVLN